MKNYQDTSRTKFFDKRNSLRNYLGFALCWIPNPFSQCNRHQKFVLKFGLFSCISLPHSDKSTLSKMWYFVVKTFHFFLSQRLYYSVSEWTHQIISLFFPSPTQIFFFQSPKTNLKKLASLRSHSLIFKKGKP